MRFTTAKEAGNPDAHLRRRPVDSILVGSKKIGKVFLQFLRHDVFFQLLPDIFIFNVADLDDTLQVTVDGFGKHIFNFHDSSLFSGLCGMPGNSYLPQIH